MTFFFKYWISFLTLLQNEHISADEYPALKMFQSSYDVRGGTSRLASNHKANKEKKESIIQDDLWAVETSSCDSTADEPIEISSSPSTPTRLKNQYHLRPENLILQRTVAGRPQTQKVSNNAVSHLEVRKPSSYVRKTNICFLTE